MSKETMKLALEALEGLEALLLSMGLTHLIVYGDAEKAITNLREALAKQPAQHEPFTHYRHYDNGLQDWADEKTIPLYTSPPAQRTWVGLTDDELADFWFKQSLDWMEFARVIEDALRSKNT